VCGGRYLSNNSRFCYSTLGIMPFLALLPRSDQAKIELGQRFKPCIRGIFASPNLTDQDKVN